MNYSGLDLCDVLNGEGFRASLFVSGCGKIPKCKSCYNNRAWDFNFGYKFTDKTGQIIINELKKDYVSGLSLLGGEVTDNLEDGTLFKFLNRVKKEVPNKTIWAWSGYKFEVLINDPLKKKFLEYLDVLIDGEFIPEKKNLSRAWANSENQRVIDVKKTLKKGEIVLYNLEGE